LIKSFTRRTSGHCLGTFQTAKLCFGYTPLQTVVSLTTTLQLSYLSLSLSLSVGWMFPLALCSVVLGFWTSLLVFWMTTVSCDTSFVCCWSRAIKLTRDMYRVFGNIQSAWFSCRRWRRRQRAPPKRSSAFARILLLLLWEPRRSFLLSHQDPQDGRVVLTRGAISKPSDT
jgi:hypothetical protein